MPDRPEGDHRRTHVRAPLVLALTLISCLALASAASAAKRPSVSSFSFSPSAFVISAPASAASSNPPTTIRFRLSKPGTVTIKIAKRTVGRRSGSRCVKSSAALAKRKACTRWRKTGSIVASGLKAGKRSLSFTGRLKGTALSQGTYRATIVAIANHRRSKAKRVTFKVRAAKATTPTNPTPNTPTGPAGSQRRNIRPCSVTLPSTAAVASAVSSAAPGSVICLAPGTYGKLSLSARPAGEVVVQPNGRATVAGAELAGSRLTLEGFDVVGDEVTVEPGSDHMTVQFNRISGGHFGLDAGPTTTTTVNDVTIRGNKFAGNFGEDAIRLNRYHDGDGDGVGILIEGNEITGVVENGEHNDCLQTVWVGDHLVFRKNWLHGNNCQGFFIKDQASAVDGVVVEDNLIVDHNVPCQPASLCPTWVLSPVQIFGPITSLRMANNTVWTPFRSGSVFLREGTYGSVQFVNNVTYQLQAPDGASPFANYTAANNVTCSRTGSWPATGVTSSQCSLPFPNPAAGDYRLGNGRGVTWAPAEQQYGP